MDSIFIRGIQILRDTSPVVQVVLRIIKGNSSYISSILKIHGMFFQHEFKVLLNASRRPAQLYRDTQQYKFCPPVSFCRHCRHPKGSLIIGPSNPLSYNIYDFFGSRLLNKMPQDFKIEFILLNVQARRSNPNDLDELLNTKSAKELESKRNLEEIDKLLGTPSIKEISLAQKFKSNDAVKVHPTPT